jgi:leucyl aminopeptidase (aminopeptidase T)
MRSEYKHLELVKAAMTLVRDVMLAKSGENVLLTVDTATDLR